MRTSRADLALVIVGILLILSSCASDTATAPNEEDGESLCNVLFEVSEADTLATLKSARAAFVALVRNRFGGKISGATAIGSQEATEHSRRMSTLMRLWNPIGYSAQEVQSVLGPPSEEWKRGERKSFTHYAGFQYNFDFGTSGSHWQFTVEGESVEPTSTISGIRYIPGE